MNRHTHEIYAMMLNALEKQYTREGGSETVRLRTRRSVCVLRGFSRVQLFVAPQALSASKGFSWQKYWSGLPFPPPGHLPNPGIEPMSPESPEVQADSFPLSHRGYPRAGGCYLIKFGQGRSYGGVTFE